MDSDGRHLIAEFVEHHFTCLSSDAEHRTCSKEMMNGQVFES